MSLMSPLQPKARRFITLTALLGAVVLSRAIARWDSPDLLKYGGFLMVAIFSSGMRISGPGITGNLSLNFLFILFGVIELTQSETIVLGTMVTLIQCFWQEQRRHRTALLIFNTTSIAVAIAVSEQVYRSSWMVDNNIDQAVRLAATACTLFLLTTVQSARAVVLAEGGDLISTWRQRYFWSLGYYLGGAVIAQLASLGSHFLGWPTVLLTGPVVYLIYRSYCLYLQRLEDEKKHAEQVSSLHLRTIEALALAIEAKDHTTHDHLQRVQVYAMELAKELGLSPTEQEALRAAALLHDIGKLAVPEHIISKPGRLTPEEFEKMKIHPIVGAEILERVQFPCPVVPIVRAHHERWDGMVILADCAGKKFRPVRESPTPWRNWPLNHPPRRPPSSVLFCLKSKPRYARERRTTKSGNGSPKPGSISRAKRFAGSFAAHVKEIAYPRRGGKSVEAPKLHVQPTATSVEHDPAANFRRVEAPRPGFHFRATHDVDVLVHGRRESHKQNKR